MALGSKRRAEDESQIDLTPMLDVVFIMLIFFIVTASFVKESGIGVQRPPTTDQPPPETQQKNIVFFVDENNEITLEGRRIDVRAVRANVERIHAENPEAKVIINAHPKAKTEVFVKISDQARQAGVYDISLATRPAR
ncbi:MAG: biopolymer transporter ExbD [Porticoccaceae bacterium]|nr:MAG: biopolymer transporter ExbD [Porticoccaceae bacterium]